MVSKDRQPCMMYLSAMQPVIQTLLLSLVDDEDTCRGKNTCN